METAEPSGVIVKAMNQVIDIPVGRTRAVAVSTPRSERDAGEWVEAETVSQLSAAGCLAQAGAGALLLAVVTAELLLGAWAAGLWQRGALLALAVVGLAALWRALPGLADASSPLLRD